MSWRTAAPTSIRDGSHVLVVAGDGAVELASARVRGGEIEGITLHAWHVSDTDAIPPEDATPAAIARTAGWTPVASEGPTTIEVETVRSVHVELARPARHDPIEAVAAAVVLVVVIVAAATVAPHLH